MLLNHTAEPIQGPLVPQDSDSWNGARGLFGEIHTRLCSLPPASHWSRGQGTCLEPSMTWSLTLPSTTPTRSPSELKTLRLLSSGPSPHCTDKQRLSQQEQSKDKNLGLFALNSMLCSCSLSLHDTPFATLRVTLAQPPSSLCLKIQPPLRVPTLPNVPSLDLLLGIPSYSPSSQTDGWLPQSPSGR